MIPYKYKEFWRKIRNWINPRQDWLIKKIPNQWIDKDTLWEICILEGIKHFVEGEEAFKILASDNPPEQAKFMKELRENYELITKTLPQLEQSLEDAWKKVPKWDLQDLNNRKIDYEAAYGEVNRFEKEIEDLKTKVMLWAVNNKNWMWT